MRLALLLNIKLIKVCSFCLHFQYIQFMKSNCIWNEMFFFFFAIVIRYQANKSFLFFQARLHDSAIPTNNNCFEIVLPHWLFKTIYRNIGARGFVHCNQGSISSFVCHDRVSIHQTRTMKMIKLSHFRTCVIIVYIVKYQFVCIQWSYQLKIA